jgi:predicted phosphodiesterase
MKTIQYISDFHLDFHQYPIYSLKGLIKETRVTDSPDILIIAGDLMAAVAKNNNEFKLYLSYLSDFYQNIIYVPGNHDYYNSELEHTDEVFNKIESKISNLHILNDKKIIIDGQGFVGGTLWHKAENSPRFSFLKENISDYVQIPKASFLKKNMDTIKFFEKNIKSGDIVISHHMPHEKCISDLWKNNQLNMFFCNYDLENLILDLEPSYFIYGHTHTNIPDFKIGNTTFCINTWGYFSIEKDEMSRTKRIIF